MVRVCNKRTSMKAQMTPKNGNEEPPAPGTPSRGDDLIELRREADLRRKRAISRRFTFFNLAANILLALAKGVIGILTGSLAITADAINSLTDSGYSLVLVVGMHFSLRPADPEHPEGHRRIEPLISMGIGAAIAIVAYQLVTRGVGGLRQPETVAANTWTIIVLVGAMGVKGYLAWRARRNARQIHSPALAAVSRDAAVDILATLAALVGYGGAVLGWQLADPIFSLVVAVFVARTAYQVLAENIGYITGRAAPAEIREEVERLACSPDGVHAVHDLKVYFSGPDLHVSLHLEVDRNETFETVHDLEQQVRLRVLEIPEVDNVAVHLDPVDSGTSSSRRSCER